LQFIIICRGIHDFNAGAGAADQISIKIANLGNLQTNEILHSISKKHSIVDLITCTFVQQFNLFHAKLVLLQQQQHIL
jgi:hypothetical protein